MAKNTYHILPTGGRWSLASSAYSLSYHIEVVRLWDQTEGWVENATVDSRAICAQLRPLIERIRTASALSIGKAGHRFRDCFSTEHVTSRGSSGSAPSLERAVQAFFSLSFDGAEKSIDDAWLKLLPDDQTSPSFALIPLRLSIAEHWHDLSVENLEIELFAAYESKTPLQLPQRFKWSSLIAKENVPLRNASRYHNFHLRKCSRLRICPKVIGGSFVTLEQEAFRWSLPAQIVSRTKALESRLTGAKEKFEQLKSKDPDTKQRSTQLMLNLLRDLNKGRSLETDFPAHQILQTVEKWDAETKALPVIQDTFSPGQFWLELDGKKSSTVVRVSVQVKRQTSYLFCSLFTVGWQREYVLRCLWCRRNSFTLSPSGLRIGLSAAVAHGWRDIGRGNAGAIVGYCAIDVERVAVLGHSMGALKRLPS